MLYIDQPIATGFSYGDDSVNSTLSSAPYIWRLLQAFYSQFPLYKNRDFGIFTESYGGHYGPRELSPLLANFIEETRKEKIPKELKLMKEKNSHPTSSNKTPQSQPGN